MGRGYSHYIRRRVDDNQPEIVTALEACGYTVQSLAAIGKGCPDILVGVRGTNLLLEIKDGSKVPSKRELTTAETAWHSRWRGQVRTVETVREALEACGARLEVTP